MYSPGLSAPPTCQTAELHKHARALLIHILEVFVHEVTIRTSCDVITSLQWSGFGGDVFYIRHIVLVSDNDDVTRIHAASVVGEIHLSNRV